MIGQGKSNNQQRSMQPQSQGSDRYVFMSNEDHNLGKDIQANYKQPIHLTTSNGFPLKQDSLGNLTAKESLNFGAGSIKAERLKDGPNLYVHMP